MMSTRPDQISQLVLFLTKHVKDIEDIFISSEEVWNTLDETNILFYQGGDDYIRQRPYNLNHCYKVCIDEGGRNESVGYFITSEKGDITDIDVWHSNDFTDKMERL